MNQRSLFNYLAFKLSTLSVLDVRDSRIASCALNLIYTVFIHIDVCIDCNMINGGLQNCITSGYLRVLIGVFLEKSSARISYI